MFLKKKRYIYKIAARGKKQKQKKHTHMHSEDQYNLWSCHRVNLADMQIDKHKTSALVQWFNR